MLRLPFWDELEKAENVLLAGAGGGFDIFCGLPLYFALKSAGKTVHLANLSFSLLPPPGTGAKERLSPSMLEVTADTPLFTSNSQFGKNTGRNSGAICRDCAAGSVTTLIAPPNSEITLFEATQSRQIAPPFLPN